MAAGKGPDVHIKWRLTVPAATISDESGVAAGRRERKEISDAHLFTAGSTYTHGRHFGPKVAAGSHTAATLDQGGGCDFQPATIRPSKVAAVSLSRHFASKWRPVLTAATFGPRMAAGTAHSRHSWTKRWRPVLSAATSDVHIRPFSYTVQPTPLPVRTVLASAAAPPNATWRRDAHRCSFCTRLRLIKCLLVLPKPI